MKLNENKYSNYSTEQFLADDFFLKSILSPSEATDLFWDEMLSDNKFDKKEFERAKAFILAINKKKDTHVLDEKLISLWNRISESVEQKSTQRHNRPVVKFIYAATVAASIAGLIMLLNINHKPEEQIIDGVKLSDISSVEMSDKIQLVSSDDRRIEFSDRRVSIDYSDKDGIRVNEEVYTRKEIDGSKDGKITYNQLLVPFGKQSQVILSDGSKIWVNAGTRVIYPEVFAADKREIYVNGEIYGDIAHDPNKPFVIKTSGVTVEVLGTILNVSDYASDRDISVVLVQGSVRLRYDDGKQLSLRPNEMFYSSTQGSGVKTVDVPNFISWKDGYLHFKSEKLEEILKKMSKYYGVDIVCDQSVGDIKCSGDLSLKEDFITVLKGICSTASVKFEFEDNTYKITKTE